METVPSCLGGERLHLFTGPHIGRCDLGRTLTRCLDVLRRIAGDETLSGGVLGYLLEHDQRQPNGARCQWLTGLRSRTTYLSASRYAYSAYSYPPVPRSAYPGLRAAEPGHEAPRFDFAARAREVKREDPR